jgi:hypothetical protein
MIREGTIPEQKSFSFGRVYDILLSEKTETVPGEGRRRIRE